MTHKIQQFGQQNNSILSHGGLYTVYIWFFSVENLKMKDKKAGVYIVLKDLFIPFLDISKMHNKK